LLVEDNANDVELSLRVFQKFNMTRSIHVVRDGAASLDFMFCTGVYAGRALLEPPKVVLLDLKIPKIDGLEVLRRLKADPRTCSVPVVVLTSSREDRDITEC